MNNTPLVSIIIATYNSAGTLQRCLDSIRYQIYPAIEVIIIDGASTDETLKLLESNSDLISDWKSEPDYGIYDAWNKAIQIANGTWYYFLGSDDILHAPDCLSKIMKRISTIDKETLVAYGDVLMLHPNGTVRRNGAAWEKTSAKMMAQMSLAHQGVFHSRDLFTRFGGFDSSFQIAGDYKIIMQSLTIMPPVYLGDIIVAEQFVGGKSALRKNRVAALLEFRRVQVSLGLGIRLEWFWAFSKGLIWLVLSKFRDVRS
jgi:glycosyltransferase involved in cell wall biosynthesis